MPIIRLQSILGQTSIPNTTDDRFVTQVFNALLEPGLLCRRRPSTVAVSLTSGPSSTIRQLFRHQPAADFTAAELWAWSGTTTLHRRASGTWASVTPSDTVSDVSASRPYAATFNGKLFLAYNSDVNRLHVWDGTSVRRVGIEASAAATVADTGAGAYAATIRYYKIQFKIKSGSDTIATSELSASVTFTPSGAGTAARVTKPTTPDSATHWVVFGSADNITYYDISGDTVVGTTTYDDSVAPSAYSSGTVAPTAGLSVPPPSAKYLLAGDNRLFMAGAWETTATSKQTGVRNSRVWFTAVLGARDNTGEDEAIVQTTDLKHYVDIGENDGDTIVGLGGPLEGMIYVFKQRSIWRLVPTGLVDVPYRADQVSATIGAVWQDGIAMGETGSGRPALYVMSLSGPRRLTANGVEDIGMDVRGQVADLVTVINPEAILRWDARRRLLWCFFNEAATTYSDFVPSYTYAFQPDMEVPAGNGAVRGGWTSHSINAGVASTDDDTRAAVMYELSNVLVPYIGGKESTSTAVLATISGAGISDADGTALNAALYTRAYQPGELTQTCRVRPPIVEYAHLDNLTTVAAGVTLYSVTHSPVYPTSNSITGSTVAVAGIDGGGASSFVTVAETIEGVSLDNLIGFALVVTIPAENWSNSGRPGLVSLTIPYTLQDPL